MMKKLLSLLCLLYFLTVELSTAQTQLWTTSPRGGIDGAGAIARMNPDGSGYSTVFSFPVTGVNGAKPIHTNPIQASNGKLYFMTSEGGLHGKGAIISYDPVASTFSLLYSFKGGSDGEQPNGSLMQASDGHLYGLTAYGGINLAGIIFRFNISTNTLTKHHDFASGTGMRPYGGLMQASNGILYGMTYLGGVNAMGTLFSFNPVSLTHTKLIDFDGTLKGRNPYGDLMQASNGKLYGVTYNGGVNSRGVLFNYEISTNTLTKRWDFVDTTGSRCYGKLIESGGLLYGAGAFGGTSGLGAIYSFNDNTSSYTVLYNFSGAASSGSNPRATLALASNGKIYGTTESGVGNSGTLFSFEIATGTYAKLVDFTGTANGGSPTCGVVQASNGKLYGMTTAGGANANGVFYSYDITLSIFTKISDLLVMTNGGLPQNGLCKASNGLYYGMTERGGTFNGGTIFSFNPVTGIHTKLYDFPNQFFLPKGRLMQASNGLLYGMTDGGGTIGFGTLFSFNISTATLTTHHNFNGSATGRIPLGSLVQASDGMIYGMTTYGGANDVGVLFRFDPVPLSLTKLVDFSSATHGQWPHGSLIQAANGLLYGLAFTGGANSQGTLFSFNTVSLAFNKHVDFSSFASGAYPYGDLLRATDGFLYGLTSAGGSGSGGTLFRFDTGTNTRTTLFNFQSGTNDSLGSEPFGSLFQASNGDLYGMTQFGGAFDLGTAFRYNISTATLTKLRNLNVPDAVTPTYSTFLQDNIVITTAQVILPGTSICAGTTLNVAYTVNGTLNAGNIFTAQLSDASGSFTSPVNIGTLASTTSGTISATIPSGTATGTGYRIRVVSSNPAINGTNNGTNITISPYQFTVFTESMGTGFGIQTVSSYEASNGFDNDSYTMTADLPDVRDNSPTSGGYVGASGGMYIFFPQQLGYFQIEGINTLGLSGLEISFAIKKSVNNNSSDPPLLEVSSDGLNYTTLSYTAIPTGSGTSNNWYLRTATGSIPSAANLRIRFRQAASFPTNQFRIDDIKMTATAGSPGIGASPSNYFCTGNTVTLTSFISTSYSWSTGATTQSIVVGTTGNYSCVITSGNGCTLTQSAIAVTEAVVKKDTVTGGGSYCSFPGTGVPVGLSSSSLTVTYQLVRNGTVNVGGPMPGTGSALSFGNQTVAGTYTVIGTSTLAACTATMTGSATVTVTAATTYYFDSDGDGHAGSAVTLQVCGLPPAGYYPSSTDCNDADPLEYPGQTWYIDGDGDDYGTGATVMQCARPVNGYVIAELVSTTGDCNDANVAVNPGASEVCDGQDNDCDLYVDEGCGTPIYCIGPSASYTPPSGPSYANQFSPYPTLAAAMTALNSFPVSSVIFELQNDYTSTGETYPITITFQGTPSATAVIRPRSDVSVPLLINGSIPSGGSMFNMNGCDYITFDGSPGGVLGSTSYINIRNSYVSGSSGMNFLIYNDARNNRLNALKIEGGFNANPCIRFGTTTFSGGNDQNTVSNCIIRDQSNVATVPPLTGIYSEGTGSGSQSNSGNQFTGNQFNNVVRGIVIGPSGNNGSWTVTGNHYYYSNSSSLSSPQKFIGLTGADTFTVIISGNYIGGSMVNAAGSAMVNTSASVFQGIQLQIGNTSTAAQISGNILKNYLATTSGSLSFTGIDVWGGPADIMNNKIGEQGLGGMIKFNSATAVNFNGIYSSASQNSRKVRINANSIENIIVNYPVTGILEFSGINYNNQSLTVDSAIIKNNLIRSITIAGGYYFTGYSIWGGPSGPGTFVINNVLESISTPGNYNTSWDGLKVLSAPSLIDGNRIGSLTTPNDIVIGHQNAAYGINVNIQAPYGRTDIKRDTVVNIFIDQPLSSSTFSAVRLLGASSGFSHEISDNFVTEIQTRSSKAGTLSSPINYALQGIYINEAGLNAKVNNNKITRLKAVSGAPSAIFVSGITMAKGGYTVERNYVAELENNSTAFSPPPVLAGIMNTNSDAMNYYNNMVSLSDPSNSNGLYVYAIADPGSGSNLVRYWHNSATIGGTTIGGRSAVFFRPNPTPNRSVRNNIFHNVRSGGGSHYAIMNESGSLSWTPGTSDYNNLYAATPATVGYWGGVDHTFASWQAISGCDANSKNFATSFFDVNLDLHLQSAGNCDLDGTGEPGLLTTDYDGASRSATLPDIGADEFTGYCLTFKLKTFIDGFYRGSGTLAAVVDPVTRPVDCDTLILQLANPSSPYAIVYSDTAILKTNGTVQFDFPPAILGNNYYLVVRHRNALETWSAAPVPMINLSTYDFSTGSAQAYGNNLKNMNDGRFALYSGDIGNPSVSGLQDGFLNTLDRARMEISLGLFLTGYDVSDITGDGLVDAADYSLLENNAYSGIAVLRP